MGARHIREGFSDILVGQVDLTGRDVLEPVDPMVICHFVNGLGKFFGSVLVECMSRMIYDVMNLVSIVTKAILGLLESYEFTLFLFFIFF